MRSSQHVRLFVPLTTSESFYLINIYFIKSNLEDKFIGKNKNREREKGRKEYKTLTLEERKDFNLFKND